MTDSKSARYASSRTRPCGAPDRIRTGMPLRAREFKSLASTFLATEAIDGGQERNLHLYSFHDGFTDRWAHSCPAYPLAPRLRFERRSMVLETTVLPLNYRDVWRLPEVSIPIPG